jgi:hypothetical protein
MSVNAACATHILVKRGMRLLSLLVVIAACGGSSKPATTPTTEPPPPDPGVLRQTLVGWGQQAGTGGKTNVFLEVGDHTGSSKSYPLGAAVGPCGPAAGRDDIISVFDCVTSGTGSQYRAVHRGDAIIVLRRAVDPADDPNDIEFSFQEILRVDIPIGAKVGPAL